MSGLPLRKLLRDTAEAITVLGVESISKEELRCRLRLTDEQLDEHVRRLDEREVLSRSVATMKHSCFQIPLP